jgi:hypothetical protein
MGWFKDLFKSKEQKQLELEIERQAQIADQLYEEQVKQALRDKFKQDRKQVQPKAKDTGYQERSPSPTITNSSDSLLWYTAGSYSGSSSSSYSSSSSSSCSYSDSDSSSSSSCD